MKFATRKTPSSFPSRKTRLIAIVHPKSALSPILQSKSRNRRKRKVRSMRRSKIPPSRCLWLLLKRRTARLS